MDGNIPSGESFIRQLLYGQQVFRNVFGRLVIRVSSTHTVVMFQFLAILTFIGYLTHSDIHVKCHKL